MPQLIHSFPHTVHQGDHIFNIRVGFSRLWKDKNYQAIVDIANRLPEQTIQEDPNLLMYYDISLSRV